MQREKILVRGVNWLGDAVMTTPALQRLREFKPQAQITLLTPRKLAGLWQHHPDIDDVIAVEDKESIGQVANRLRPHDFSLALIFPNSPRSALEVFFARIPKRIGYGRAWRRLFLTQSVPARREEIRMRKRTESEVRQLTQTPPQTSHRSVPSWPPTAHHIFQFLHLTAALGASSAPAAPRLQVMPEEIEEAKALLTSAGHDVHRRWLGLNPGAEYGPAKRWPRERFVETAIALQKSTGCGWVVFGGRNDVELADPIGEAIRGAGLGPVINLAGRTTLRQLCAAFRLCDVLLTNDTGPMHVAGALGTPVVGLFGSTSPELTGPGLPLNAFRPHQLIRAEVPCSPCFLRECPIDFRCMTGLSVDRVVQAVQRAIESRRP